MKRSDIFRSAQVAVVQYSGINIYQKLEVLRELMSQEDLAKYVEERESQNETV